MEWEKHVSEPNQNQEPNMSAPQYSYKALTIVAWLKLPIPNLGWDILRITSFFH